MARQIDRLNARRVKTLGEGFHADGGGLYLKVEAKGARRWVFVFRHGKKRCEMGLGALADVSLATARDIAQQARGQVKAGKNPIDERRRERAAVKAIPFGDLADQVVEDLEPHWKNPKVAQQWRTTLTVDAAALRPILVCDATTDDVLKVLKQIWLQKPETASRLRCRIERVFDVAKVRGMRQGENPARWKGHLSLMLPKRNRRRRHHPALHYDRAKTFFANLHGSESISAQALEFTILTVARTNEARFARGIEIDLKQALWIVPAERVKTSKEYRIPLSPPALAIARQRIEICGPGLLFPGQQQRGRRNDNGPRPISNMAMSKMLKLLGYGDITVHGWRATFKSWATDKTAFPREMIEHCLGHLVGDAAEQAYLRTDALERRRGILEAWAQYCEPAGASVIRLVG
jgi:integrase